MHKYKHDDINFTHTLAFRIAFLSAFVTILFIGAIYLFYFYITEFIEREIQYNSSFITDQLCKNVQSSLDSIDADVFSPYSLNMLLSKNVGRVISEGDDSDYLNTVRRLDIKTALDQMLYLSPSINWIAVADTERNIFYSSKQLGKLPYDMAGNYGADFAETRELHGGVIWHKGDGNTLMLMRMIYNLNTMHPCGYAIVNIEKTGVGPIFENVSSDKSGDFILFDNRLQPMMASATSVVPMVQDYLLQHSELASKQFTFSSKGTDYMISQRGLYDGRLTLVHVVNLSQRQHQFSEIAFFLTLVGTIVLLTILLVTVLFFKNAANSVHAILGGIRAAADGDFHTMICIRSDDEFGLIARHVNIMAKKIEHLLETISADEKARQLVRYQMLEFRYNTLQAQVNPHFLFNALESINGIAKLSGDTMVSGLVCRLARLFRGNIDRTQKLCPLVEELDYVDNYLALYKEMYPDKLMVSYEFDSLLGGVSVPTFILQPIVENAIVHGIERKLEIGHILIRTQKDDGKLILTVRDDGGGIPRQKLQELLSQLSGTMEERRNKRVGIVNVQERIALLYGKGYGLQIQSRQQEFTEVRIVLPENGGEL